MGTRGAYYKTVVYHYNSLSIIQITVIYSSKHSVSFLIESRRRKASPRLGTELGMRE